MGSVLSERAGSRRSAQCTLSMKQKIALIGTGGTISTRSNLGSLDFVNYMASGSTLEVDEVLALVPEAHEQADILPVKFRATSSTAIGFAEWLDLARLITRTEAEHPDVDGFVILHGTATMEETANFLHLCLGTRKPVVITGSQRPLSGISSDAPINLINALRVASDPAAHDMGVLVCLNDEIHAAREVTKGATSRLHAFRSPDFGMLGEVNGAGVNFYRRPLRRGGPDTEFCIAALSSLPRVDIVYCYAGDDGTLVRALVAAGARGIVMASFPGGRLSPAQKEACTQAVQAGVTIVISTRSGSGHAHVAHDLLDAGMIPAGNLNPQKARVLLALALSVSSGASDIERIFESY